MSARRLAGAAAFGALALLASRIGGENRLARADRTAFEIVRARRSRAGIVVARAVSSLAEPAVVYPLLALAGIAAAPRIGWQRACAPCLVVASGAFARRRLSRAIARPRPPSEAWLTVPEGFSLPSKHTTLAALAVGAGMRTSGLPGAVGAADRAWPLLTAAVVGTSRVYLGVHWPADVVAGWLFAEGWLRLIDPGGREVT
ncbi:MAG: phosphatase PAP2 family protein [Streptosporangiaceae bacterium]